MYILYILNITICSGECAEMAAVATLEAVSVVDADTLEEVASRHHVTQQCDGVTTAARLLS